MRINYADPGNAVATVKSWHDLLPFGIIPEGALRPLIAKRNEDIAPSIVLSLKSALNKKGFEITNSYVRKLIAETRRKTVDSPPYPKLLKKGQSLKSNQIRRHRDVHARSKDTTNIRSEPRLPYRLK